MTITCADCGSTQTIPLLPSRASAACHRCDRVLRRRAGSGFELPLAASAAVFLLLPPAVFLPLMYSTIQNLLFDDSRLVSSVGTIYREVWFPFAFGFLFFAFLFPAIRALLLVLVLGSIQFGWPIPQRGRLFRFAEELRIWSMTDVVVIAGVIAYLRAAIPADVQLQVGALCYLAVAILAFVADRSLDRRAIWNAILPDCDAPPAGHAASCSVCEMVVPSRHPGDPCPRCNGTLERDAAKRFAPALAAVAAAIPLCLPAYSFSVMVNDQLTAVIEHTVVGTVQLLADYGYWQFGVVVLIAGVVIPLVELAGMIWLLVRVRFPSPHGLVLRTRVYRMMHRLIRWPMILPFIAALAAPIVDFRGIDDIVAGPGSTPLFMLIALIMLAIRLFEPRLMWKTAGAT
ncbi:MAG TPA: paraquat-inducible protein A [Thermoanaerobaculia bacterium]|nr:paraquat-inducible protein A [Thermoanaerobaculia bacterium]